MPTYTVTDPNTGQSISLTGDSPPTEQELEQVFSQNQQPQAAQAQPQQQPEQQLPQQPIQPTPFPEEKGTSRANQELDELGSGGLLSDQPLETRLKLGSLIAVSTNDSELADIISSQIPGIGKSFAPDGSILLRNNETGAQIVVNKPGLSKLDIIQGLGLASTFTPAGRFAAIGTTLGKKALIGAATSGLTQAGIEGVQASQGGEFNEGDVALSTVLGGAAEVAVPAIAGSVQKIKAAFQPLDEAIDPALKQAIDQGKVLTTDVFPPKTIVGNAIRGIGEKIPVLGTGRVRAAQQASREKSISDFLIENNVSLDSNFMAEVVKSAKAVDKKSWGRAAELRKSAIDALEGLGNVPTDKVKNTIAQLIQTESAKATGDKALVQKLTDIASDLSTGNFKDMAQVRTNIFNEISSLGTSGSTLTSKSDGILTQVAGELSETMNAFAKNAKVGSTDKATKQAFNKWNASNKIFKESFARAKDGALKRVLSKGEVTPEIINSVIRGGKPSQLRQLSVGLNSEGRASVRQTILQNALDAATNKGAIDANTFAKQLDSPHARKAIGQFFKGKDKRALAGMKKFLQMTERAQSGALKNTLSEEVTGLAIIGSTSSALSSPWLSILAGSIGLGARALESAPVRNLLIKLSTAKPAAQTRILQELQALITSSAPAAGQVGEQ